MQPAPIDVEQTIGPMDIMVSKSNEKGNITYVNPVFTKISGYSEKELKGQPHDMLRHPDMPKIIDKLLQENLEAGKEFYAFVKNLCKDGKYAWILAHVRRTDNPDGTFRHYAMTGNPVSSHAKDIMTELYVQLSDVEKSEGLEAAEEVLKDYLVDNGITFETFNEGMLELNRS